MSRQVSAAAGEKGHGTMFFGQPGGGSTLPKQISVEFDAGPSAASAARDALVAVEQRMEPELMDDVRLLVSELVTNSVRHSSADPRRSVGLEVAVTPSKLRVEVSDGGRGFEPRRRDGDRSRPGGWGLYLVEQIADRWGVVLGSLTRVWFEIDRVARVA